MSVPGLRDEMNDHATTVVIQRLRRATDARGYVYEPLTAAELPAQRNVHVVMSHPGEVRGNHYHPLGREITTVSGPARVRFKQSGRIETHDVPDGETWRFEFPPGVVHAIQNTGTTPLVIVSFNTLPHDPANPSVVREAIL
jgi:UDP-2-acetamido-2,6-beta-L-arabino-hexul-4-ose reductase